MIRMERSEDIKYKVSFDELKEKLGIKEEIDMVLSYHVDRMLEIVVKG